MKSVKLLLAFSFILYACSDEYEIDDIVITNNVASSTVILQERDPSFPLILSKTKTKLKDDMLTRAALSHEEYLGRSFHLENYPYDDEMNLGYPVVDFLKADEKGYITSHSASRSITNYFAFSDYDHYLEKSKVTNTVTSGFKLDLGIFSFGHKKTMTEVFESSLLMNNTQVVGEADIYIQSKLHELQYSSIIRKNIILYYLNDVFKDEIYNTHTSEFYKNYGGFVLKKFITGGRATALYYGEINESYAFESTEKIMNETIDVGIKYKDQLDGDSINLSADLEFGISDNDGNSKEISKKFTSLNYSVQTVGGIPVYPAFPSPKDLFEFKIDLSGWLSSLSDPSNHALIRIYDEGLVPISDLVLEENVADRINFCIEGKELRELCEPEICIYDPEKMLRAEGEPPTRIFVYLHTRNNEYILLESMPYENSLQHTSAIYCLQMKYAKIFKSRIVTTTKKPVSDFYYESPSWGLAKEGEMVFTFPYIVYDYRGAKIEDCKVYKAVDGTIYLLDTEKKNGYSIYSDYLLDTYAIRDYVNALPTVDINVESLFDYKILAL